MWHLPHWHPDRKAWNKNVTRLQHAAHMAYLGGVAIETHYVYGKIAAIMLITSVAALFLKIGAED